jgi:hypothetical protein
MVCAIRYARARNIAVSQGHVRSSRNLNETDTGNLKSAILLDCALIKVLRIPMGSRYI